MSQFRHIPPVAAALLLAGCGGAALRTGPAAPYALSWSDEFDGPEGSAPDSKKWTHDTGVGGNGWGNNELESYTARLENAHIEGGNLVITAVKETYADPNDKTPREYTSARLKTQGLFSQAYGRFEARIKVPAGQGVWPAFWMLGDDPDGAGYPARGEIDVMEYVGKEPGTVYCSLHGPSRLSDTSDRSGSLTLEGGRSFSEDYHVYAAEWEPGRVAFFVDGARCASFDRLPWPWRRGWVFDHPFFILLNLAVGGDWPGPPDPSTAFPKRMLVDYVRVYSRH